MRSLILLFALVLFGCVDHEKAETAAAEYAKKLPGSTGQVSCVPADSDGDGYVSCSIFMKKGPPTAVECRSLPYKAGGCKIAAVRIKR